MAKRPVFSSQLATVLTLVGVAVGLGNVWRFPYMMGRYGGSAFLFVYLLFTVMFAVPALMGEISLGKVRRRGIIGAFDDAFGARAGRMVGIMLLVTILVASSYYVVVIANVFYSAGYAAISGFAPENLPVYERLLGNGWLQYGIAVVILSASLIILLRGLKGGIEVVSKLFMPFFLLVVLYLIWSAWHLDGAPEKFLLFLRPDFGALELPHIFAALGQAFYSLSLGGTFMVVYGSYLREETRIPRLALLTGMGDVAAALLASLFIVPTILVFGLDMTGGPRLIFSTLPHLFSILPGGQPIATLFLLALGLASVLSLVAALEVAANALSQALQWSRSRCLLLIGTLELCLALPSAFDPDVIGVLDLIFGSGMQVLGSGLALLALTWGGQRAGILKAVFGRPAQWQHHLYFLWVKWVVPLVLLAVLIGYIYSIV